MPIVDLGGSSVLKLPDQLYWAWGEGVISLKRGSSLIDPKGILSVSHKKEIITVLQREWNGKASGGGRGGTELPTLLGRERVLKGAIWRGKREVFSEHFIWIISLFVIPNYRLDSIFFEMRSRTKFPKAAKHPHRHRKAILGPYKWPWMNNEVTPR